MPTPSSLSPAAGRQAPRRSAIPVFLFALAAAALATTLIPGLVADAAAAERGTILRVGSDVTLAEGDTAEAIIAIGGDVDVAGTVTDTIVAVGGDVRLEPTAVVGSDVQAGDTSIVLVGGRLEGAAEATVTGETNRIVGSWAWDAWGRGVVDPAVNPFGGFSLISWLGSTLLYILGAIIIVALAPRQITAVRDRIARRFWSSLGWGALGLIVVVPVVTVLLVISIIGLLAILPWLFVVVATLVLGGVAVALLLGGGILPRLNYRRENLILATVVGVVILQLIQLIPVAGAIAVALAWLVGFGGTVVALWSWQRGRREHAREVRREPEAA
jgi:hypothetical protein